MEYDSAGDWGGELQSSILSNQEGGASGLSFVRSFGLSNPDEIKVAAAEGISRLQNDDSLEGQDAKIIWQYSQCLKKFRYGCTTSPEEMSKGWIERNAAMKGQRLPWWVADGVRSLLKPLGRSYAECEGEGRFGNGNVYEGLTSIARWNAIPRLFHYNPYDPDCVPDWEASPSLSCRLSAVPKDMFKLRLITVEPAELTFLQQYVRSRLLKAVQVLPLSSGIPQQLYGRGPEVQRRRCCLGSFTGTLATIDLSDASDRISFEDVVSVFPPNLAADLERARSPYCEVGGTRYRVHMFAGMGNATTFMVETLFFWAVVTTICRRLRDFTPVSVFGDDIVCGNRAANHPLFREYMLQCGMLVNMEKSGTSRGPGFREACGLVAFRGDVLPLDRVPGFDTSKSCGLERLCTLINRVNGQTESLASMKVLLYGVGRDIIQRYNVPRVPRQLASTGIYIVDPEASASDSRHRWNAQLQRREWKVRHCVQRHESRWVRDLTPFEADGVLHGQLHTQFRDLPCGASVRKSELRVPIKDAFLDKRDWMPAAYVEAPRAPESLWDLV